MSFTVHSNNLFVPLRRETTKSRRQKNAAKNCSFFNQNSTNGSRQNKRNGNHWWKIISFACAPALTSKCYVVGLDDDDDEREREKKSRIVWKGNEGKKSVSNQTFKQVPFSLLNLLFLFVRAPTIWNYIAVFLCKYISGAACYCCCCFAIVSLTLADCCFFFNFANSFCGW